MSRSLPPEVTLAAACCSWPVDPAAVARIQDAAGKIGDWARFDRVVQRNRISPLVHHALAESGIALPDDLDQALSRRVLVAARKSLAMARESLRLQQAFERAGLPVMIVKGVPLALLAYGRLGTKESWDIDLLTSPEAVAEAAKLLVELGYGHDLGHLDSQQWETYARFIKEAQFTHSASGLVVELHWALTDSRRLLPGVSAKGPAQDVAMPGGALRTLAGDELFAYLCLHGAAHNWSRLKWLADLGALIASCDETKLRRLLHVAEGYGAGRAASVALLLCNRLLGRELSEELLGPFRKSAMNRALAQNTLGGLAYRSGDVEHRRYSAPWLRTLAAQQLIEPGAAHAIEHARFVWNAPIDRRLTPLPKKLDFLYPVLRIPLWIVRFATRVAKRNRP